MILQSLGFIFIVCTLEHAFIYIFMWLELCEWKKHHRKSAPLSYIW